MTVTGHGECKGRNDALRAVVRLVADDARAAQAKSVTDYRQALLGALAELLGGSADGEE